MPDPAPPDRTLELPAAAPVAAFAPGTAFGNFRIVRELGAGGMGVVFEAYDPALDCPVAIKLVRDRDASRAAGARLIREAQAMARLAHPNVVQVYDVGTLDGQVFVVMELVRGETLATWLEQPRSWREIVGAFVQAGDGLGAVHRAGLVHRDFKPSNVLVDKAGRVRVGDFGIARDDDAGDRPMRFAGGTDGARLVGTPAYMAPEQLDRGDVDARADQYSFALSLECALSGRPPVADDGDRDAATALSSAGTAASASATTGSATGETRPVRATGRVPRRITAAIARAMRTDRAERFAAMDDLVAVLRRALDARRRAVLIATAGLAVVAIAAAVLAWAFRPAASDRCDAGAALVDTVWGPRARDALAAHVAAVRPTARVEPIARVLDDWASAWRLGRRTACHAEPPRRAAHLACLDRGLAELRAQVAAIDGGDATAIDRALPAVTALPDPALCAAQGTGASSPRATELYARIADVNAAQRGGRAGAVLAQLPALIDDAGDDPALLAAALYAAGFAELDAGQLAPAREHMVRAAREAGRAQDDDILLRALIAQASIAGELGRPQDALGLLDAADAIVARTRIDRTDRIAVVRGDALSQAGRHPEAIAELERAVTSLERKAAGGPVAQRELTTALGALASAYRLSFHYAEARALLLRVEPIETELLGPDHPELAKTFHDLAVDEGRLGMFDESAAHLARARDIFVRAYGDHTQSTITVDLSLASLALQRNDLDDAQHRYALLHDELARVVPDDHAYASIVEGALGSIARDRDQCDAGIPHFERSIAELEAAGHGGVDLAIALTNLAACYDDLDRYADARPPVERAIALLEAAQTPPVERAEALAILADVEAGTGHRKRAIELAQQIVDSCTADARPAVAELCQYERDQLAAWSK